MSEPDLFEYDNYREYIRDYYAYMKSESTHFSYRYLAQKAEINSSGYFKSLILGDKNISHSSIEKVAFALNLKGDDKKYFSILVSYNQTDSEVEKGRLHSQLVSLRILHSIPLVEEYQQTFYFKWYHSIIRELVTSSKGVTVSSIQKTLYHSLSQEEIKSSIELLLNHGLIEKQGTQYVQTNTLIKSGESIDTNSIQFYQMQMLQKAMEAFDIVPVGEKLMSSTTLFYSDESMGKAVELIRDLRKNLLELALKEPAPERVYQLNLNLFPMSK